MTTPKINPRYPFVWVVWDDAEGEAGWSDEPHLPLQPTLATSIGFLVRDEENYVLLADSYFPNSKVIGGTNKIPKKMIVEMIELQVSVKKPRAKKQKQEAAQAATVPEGTAS